MHHIYNTEAIVLGGAAVGEGDRAIWLLTRELGLLIARAQSVREEKSKMRYALQDFCVCEVSLVQGKAFWRIAGVVLIEQFHAELKDLDTLKTASKVFDLIKRLVPNEDSNTDIYKIVHTGLSALTKKDNDVEATEILLVSRLLDVLGYMPENAKYTSVIKGSDYNMNIEKDIKTLILKGINEAIVSADL